MNNINVLKEVGLKEVSKKTHIELIYLQAIVEKDFQTLCRKNVKGYIKILSREYDIDFENWMKEYSEFCLTSTQTTSTTPFVLPKIPAYRQKDRSNSSTFMAFIIILVVFLAWFFDAAKYLSMIPEILNDENRSVVYSDSKVVESVEKSIIEDNDTKTKINSDKFDQNVTNLEENSSFLLNLDLNNSIKSVEKIQIDDENISNLDINDTSLNLATDTIQEIIIKPKASMWIGIINLDNGAKKTFTIKKDFQIDTNKSQLILTGHGNFSVNINGEDRPSNTKTSARFLVKDGKFKAISLDEFMSMNKGKAW